MKFYLDDYIIEIGVAGYLDRESGGVKVFTWVARATLCPRSAHYQ